MFKVLRPPSNVTAVYVSSGSVLNLSPNGHILVKFVHMKSAFIAFQIPWED